MGAGEGLPEDLVLAEEPSEAGDPGNGEGGNEEGPKRDRNLFSESAHLSHIQFAAQGMHDAPGAKKEESFEEGMSHQMEYSCAVSADPYP